MNSDATPQQQSLRDAVIEAERFVAGDGWDGPVRVFALVKIAPALETNPELAKELPDGVVDDSATDPTLLFSVEQEGLPESSSVEELLAQLAWPSHVDGVALVAERIIVPPSVEESLPDDPQAAMESLLAHPERDDVRMAVGVLRSGESWCAVRTRSHDEDTSVIGGPDLVPGLVEGLRATLEN